MKYPLQDLVRVREYREDKASKALTLAKRKLLEAEELVRKRAEELDQYHKWRIVEEERLIQSIMLKPVLIGEVTDMRLEVAALRERELEFTDRLRKAEGERDQRQTELEEARKAYRRATQELQKLVEHREIWYREQTLEAERLADLELEDHHRPRHAA